MEGMRLAEGFGAARALATCLILSVIPANAPDHIGVWHEGDDLSRHWPSIKHTEFLWAGKDGSAILALNMLYGYSNAANRKRTRRCA